ncbi:MAG: hypothetical protein HY717_10020 [Planctomycetes bacterium]|nr:hypothetical protein [Planctomycetota bacterium]
MSIERQRAKDRFWRVDPPRSRCLGFSLLEAAIYAAVIGIITFPILSAVVGVTRTTEEGDLLAKIQERKRSALHQITNDYRRSLAGTAAVTNSDKTLSFTLPGGFNGTGASAGNAIRYELRADPTDAPNSIDDNGNGVVDENILVRVNATASEEVTIASHLDPNTSGFSLNGDAVVVSLSCMAWAKGSQRVTEVSETRTVYPRN